MRWSSLDTRVHRATSARLRPHISHTTKINISSSMICPHGRYNQMITDDRVLNVLEESISWMNNTDNQNKMEKWDHYGFSCGDVGAQGWEFHTKLEPEGLVTKTYSSNNGSQYRVTDVEEAKDYLERARSQEEESNEDQ